MRLRVGYRQIVAWVLPLFFIVLLTVSLGASLPAQASHLGKLKEANLALGSVNALVLDLDSNQPLYSKNADRVVPIASITKVMTAMVVLDSKAPMDEWLSIVKRQRKQDKNGYSRIRIGSQLKRKDLLLLALMSSENRAANVLAQSHPGGMEAFVKAMNAKAKSLGMHQTRFVNASGLSRDNISTASDLMKMIRAAAKYPEIREYSTTTKYDARFKKPRYVLYYANTNPLARKSSWDVTLSKTGYLTEAGRCLVMISTIEGHNIGMVFLDSLGKRTPIGDAGRVKRWILTGKGGTVSRAARDYERSKNSPQ